MPLVLPPFTTRVQKKIPIERVNFVGIAQGLSPLQAPGRDPATRHPAPSYFRLPKRPALPTRASSFQSTARFNSDYPKKNQ